MVLRKPALTTAEISTPTTSSNSEITYPPTSSDARHSRRTSLDIVDNLNDPYFPQDDFQNDQRHEEQYFREKSLPASMISGADQSDYWEDDSPYPEVRAAVSNADDPTMPTNTFRMWLLGLVTTIFIAGLNQFFSLRYPSVQISALVAQLVSLPLGKLLERTLPARKFTTLGFRWSLNPGPWNIKEHTLVVIMANVVAGGAYATDIIATQRTFYSQNWSMAYQISLVVSTQLLGFSFAGICRRFLVWPATMIWPATLVNAALFNTMHSQYLDDEPAVHRTQGKHNNSWYRSIRWMPKIFGAKGDCGLSTLPTDEHAPRSPNTFTNSIQIAQVSRPKTRASFFIVTLLISTIWSFFPSYVFTALSTFTPLCWLYSGIPASIIPDPDSADPSSGTTSTKFLNQLPPRRSIIINQLFGYTHGLGMGFLTFDWAMIAYNGSPLVTPWWAEANVFASLVIIFWIAAPILYYRNIWYSQYMPMSSLGSYDNTGQSYDSHRVVVDGVFRPELYKLYSPLYIPITFALSYGLSFGALTSTIVHTFLWYRKDIKRQFVSSLKDFSQNDIHSRLMLAYPEVPQSWYASIGVVAFLMGCVTCEVWDTKLPFWAYVLSIVISITYLIPIGMIQAITNMQVGLNVITELIVGYALPGKPVAMMIFKTFGYITMTQALSFVSDLKLGHYMKIPPRMMFVTQTIAAIVACFVTVGVQAWMFENIPGLCQPDQPDKFTCPGVRVFSTASLIWGGIGPARTFNLGQLYHHTLYFFLIGAGLPIPFYLLSKRYPRSWAKYVNIPVCFSGMGNFPPASGINYSSWALTGFVFQYWVRRYRFAWWSRFNYLLSAGLDAGVAVGTILVFFALIYPNEGRLRLRWWGNDIVEKTPDYLGTPFLSVTPGETFGYKEWF